MQIKLNNEIGDFVKEKFLDDYSLEEVSNYSKKNLFSINQECIYQLTLSNKQKGGEF